MIFRASSRNHIIKHLNVHGSKKMTDQTTVEIHYVWTSNPDSEPKPIENKKLIERFIFKCKKCNFETFQHKKLERHQKKHTKVKTLIEIKVCVFIL